MDKKILQTAGIDYQRGVDRCMGNAALYEKLLYKFIQDSNYLTNLKHSYENDSRQEFMMNVHTLKGMAGNLCFSSLYSGTSDLMDELRSENPEEGTIDEIFNDVLLTYEDMVIAINEALD